MSEIIIPGRAHIPTPESFFDVDDQGREQEIPLSELWAYSPDAYKGNTTILTTSELPYENWRNEGETDE